LGNVELALSGGDGALRITDRIGDFYAGRMSGRIGLDMRGDQPLVSLFQEGEGIGTGPLFTDLTGRRRLSGVARFTAALSAAGADQNALISTLSGALEAHIRDGVIDGSELRPLIREVADRFGGTERVQALPLQLGFSNLTASGEVEDGVLHNRDLVVSSHAVMIRGEGSLDLANESLDYRFEPVLLKTPRGAIARLKGIPVPVRLSGAFGDPEWDLELGSVLQELARRELDQKGGGLLRQLEEGTGLRGLEQGLRGLFGR
jgi:AsmA protein